MEVAVWDTQHYAFMDVPLLLTTVGQTLSPEERVVVDQTFGTLGGKRVEGAMNEIVVGLLELVFDGNTEPLREVGKNTDVDVVRSDLLGCE